MRMRSAGAADLGDVHALIERAYRGESARKGWTHEADLLSGQRTDAAMLAAMLADHRQRILVLREESAVRGCVQIADLGASAAYLGLLTVDPECQGAGLGKQLLGAGESLARTLFAATRIEMTVIAQRTELIAWYRRRGYAETGAYRPFPAHDARFGVPLRRDLRFTVMARDLAGG